VTASNVRQTRGSGRPDPSLRFDRFGQEKQPPIRQEAVGRLMTCKSCGALVDVLEAAQGAQSEAEHRHLNPESYVCGDCLAGGDA
jgi:hypothetical protein